MPSLSLTGRLARLALVAFLVVAAVPVAAVDLDPDTLADLPHFSDEIFTRWQVPGGAVAVVNRERVLFLGGFGHRSIAGRERVTEHTVFAAGSVAKGFTATAVGLLVDQGLVDLDRPVREVLPTFSLYNAYATLHVTPRDLLAHSTGLPRHDPVWYRSTASRAELLATLRFLEPEVELRQRFIYSNLMYLAAGALVEAVSGTSWEQVVRERIFAPLGMKRSRCATDATADADVAAPHALTADGEIITVAPYDGWAAAPAMGVSSTAADLARWLQWNLGAPSLPALLTPETLRELHRPQVVVPATATPAFPVTTYGLGWFVGSYRGRLLVWHTGSIDGFTAWVGFLPHDELGVAVVTNLARTRAPEVIARWVFDRALGLPEIDWHAYLTEQEQALAATKQAARAAALAQRDPGRPPNAPLAAYAGRYDHPAYGEIVVELVGAGLVGHLHGMSGPLTHFRDDVFILEVAGDVFEDMFELQFKVAADGSVPTVASPLEKGVRPIAFVRRVEPSGGATR